MLAIKSDLSQIGEATAGPYGQMPRWRYLTIIYDSVNIWSTKLVTDHRRRQRLQEQYIITQLYFTGVGTVEAISGQYFRQTRAGAAAPSSPGHLLTSAPRAPVHYKRGLPKTLLHQASFVSSTDNMRASLALAFLALARAAIIGMFLFQNILTLRFSVIFFQNYCHW